MLRSKYLLVCNGLAGYDLGLRRLNWCVRHCARTSGVWKCWWWQRQPIITYSLLRHLILTQTSQAMMVKLPCRSYASDCKASQGLPLEVVWGPDLARICLPAWTVLQNAMEANVWSINLGFALFCSNSVGMLFSPWGWRWQDAKGLASSLKPPSIFDNVQNREMKSEVVLP